MKKPTIKIKMRLYNLKHFWNGYSTICQYRLDKYTETCYNQSI